MNGQAAAAPRSAAGALSAGGSAGRPVHGSVAHLLEGATTRRPLDNTDGKSGAELEVVTFGDSRYVLKHVGGPGDWIARASGDQDRRAVRVWTSGLLDALPSSIDHAVVGAAHGSTPHEAAVLQRDVGPWLVPPGDTRLSVAHHRQFLDSMAAMHATFWAFTDTIGLLPLEQRYLLLSPRTVDAERARGHVPDPLPLIPRGLGRLEALAPSVAEVVHGILESPSRLAERLQRTPQTLVHGDWKAGNLGVDPSGRTVLLDWTMPGAGPACSDLAWYLAINAARLPGSKEDAIATYRAALHRHGIATDGWWDAQLGLSLLGAVVLLGWEKALGDPDELSWWVARVEEGARWLD